MEMVTVTLTKSLIGANPKQKATAETASVAVEAQTPVEAMTEEPKNEEPEA